MYLDKLSIWIDSRGKASGSSPLPASPAATYLRNGFRMSIPEGLRAAPFSPRYADQVEEWIDVYGHAVPVSIIEQDVVRGSPAQPRGTGGYRSGRGTGCPCPGSQALR
jgi:hypothetical protein